MLLHRLGAIRAAVDEITVDDPSGGIMNERSAMSAFCISAGSHRHHRWERVGFIASQVTCRCHARSPKGVHRHKLCIAYPRKVCGLLNGTPAQLLPRGLIGLAHDAVGKRSGVR